MPAQTIIAGISGFRRNAAVALYRDGRLVAVCEEGRVTRVRDVGIQAGGLPAAALLASLQLAESQRDNIAEFVVAEDGIRHLLDGATRRLDHHFAHAATSYLTAPFHDALVLVCDTHGAPEVSCWRGVGPALTPVNFGWRGPGFARIYSRITELIGLKSGRDEHRAEAMARVAGGTDSRAAALLRYSGEGLSVAPEFEDYLAEAARSHDLGRISATVHAVQQCLAELLVEVLQDAAEKTATRNVCLGGGLFFNTHLNTVIRQSGAFEEVHIPVNPGNAGLAAGCALARGWANEGHRDHPGSASPFLGPKFSNHEIKAVLDNCKLCYDFADDAEVIGRAVAALERGALVGWFTGSMEWGARALGHRSILANPFAPYVLENLNDFLKHREAYRTYSLVVCQEDASSYFAGPPSSSFMEYDYELRDPDRFVRICPPPIGRVRVQTVRAEPALLRQLLKAFGEAAGAPVLVNTSFNGFHEPIVCTPRDAVRVFYGTGLDLLVLGNFIISK